MGVNFVFNQHESYESLRVHPEYPFTNGDIVSWFEEDIDITDEPTDEDIAKIEEELLDLDSPYDIFEVDENEDELDLDLENLIQKWGLLIYEPEVGSFIIIPYLDENCEEFDESSQYPFLFEIGLDALFYPEGFEPWLEDEDDEDDE